MSKKPQIPLKDLTGAIDRNDLGFYSRLDDELKSAFSPWMAMRYASSSSQHPEHYLLMVNGLVNVDFTALRKHPELQWKLLAVCGVGRPNHHPWIAPGRAAKKDRVLEFLKGVYPGAKSSDLELLRSMLSKDEVRELAEGQGMEDKAIKELLK